MEEPVQPALDEVMRKAAEPITPSIVDSVPDIPAEEILVDKAAELADKEQKKEGE